MADNVIANPGIGGATFATDDDGTAHHPYVKLEWGADNTQTPVAAGASALPIQDGGNSITVDGTVTANAGSGNFTVVNSGTFAVQAAVTAASGSIQSGAVASGAFAAGSIAAGAVAAGATSFVKLEDVASAGGDAGVPAMAIQLATPADTAADGDYVMLQMSAGRVWVDASGKTLTVASHAVTNAGTFAVQVDGNALTALQKIDDPVLVDDAAFTPATSSVSMAGFEADETATDSVDEGDAGAARMTLDRKQIVTMQPHTSGGLLIARDLDLDNGTLTVVKNAAGQLYGMTATNRGTVPVYVKFYDAASGTLGTGTPVITIEIPSNASDHTTLAQAFTDHGLAFGTGICVGAGTGIADNDNTDPGANIVLFNCYYK